MVWEDNGVMGAEESKDRTIMNDTTGTVNQKILKLRKIDILWEKIKIIQFRQKTGRIQIIKINKLN